MISEVPRNKVNSLTTFRFIIAFIVFLFHCVCHIHWQFPAMELGKKFHIIYPSISLHNVVLGMLCINIFIASLSYHLVEERFRKKILSKIKQINYSNV